MVKRIAEDKRKAKEEEENRVKESRKQNVDIARQTLPGFDKESEDSAAAVRDGMSRAAQEGVGKRFDAFKDDPDKLRAHEKQRKHQAVEKAKEAISGLDDSTKLDVAMARLRGGDTKQVHAKLKADLIAKGLSPEDADAAAGETVKTSDRSVREHMARLTGRQGDSDRDRGPSRIFATNDLTSHIQGGVGGKDEMAKDQLKELRQQNDYLKQLVDKKALEFQFRT